MRFAASFSFAFFAALMASGCNAVFGLEELRLADRDPDAQKDVGSTDASPDGSSEVATGGNPDASDAGADQKAIGTGDGGVCASGQMRCTLSGLPQKCNEQGTEFEDLAACRIDKPACDPATGLCMVRCQPGTKRCGPSASLQQCDLGGVWRDLMTCPFACTGTGDAVACGGSCKPGTRSCGANNTPLLCDDSGTNQMQMVCAGACTGNGVCAGDCAPNVSRCSTTTPNGVETCDANGHWGAAVACTFVCDPATKSCSGECSPGTADRCSGSTVQSCDATSHWKDKTACGTIPCTMGRCAACSPNTKQCNAGKPQTCNTSGTWVDDQAAACMYICDAATGRCAGECIPGTDACMGQSTKRCGANGLYAAPTACMNICDTSTGRCGGVCSPNSHRCNGSSAQTCGANGQWGSDMPCQFGCNAGTGVCNTCTSETNATFCSRLGKACGTVTGTDNCGVARTVQSCGNCNAPETCSGGGTPNVCGCTKESDATFCSRLGRVCGSFSGTDNCGAPRTVANCPGSCQFGCIASTGQCAKPLGAACSPGECGSNPCVAGRCCENACNGVCDTQACDLAGKCLHKAVSTSCGTRTLTQPGVNDIALICNAAGQCVGPQIGCGPSHASCDLTTNACCQTSPSSNDQPITIGCSAPSACCGSGSNCLESNGITQDQRWFGCKSSSQCPLNQICCPTSNFLGNFGQIYTQCQATHCSTGEECDPNLNVSQCFQGGTCENSGSDHNVCIP